MDSKTISYTSANSYPLKILKNRTLIDRISAGGIIPLHAQLIPTNRCNLACSFCSCKERDRGLELSVSQIMQLLDDLEYLGCRALTVTGGGEPLMYPHINEIILACFARDIKVGLVTNGLRLDDLNTEALSTITWCRISCCDERYLNQVPADIIEDAVKRGICVDWAFSYVVGRNYNPDNLKVYIQLANKYNFTHIRVVTDLVDLEKGIDIEKVRESVAGIDSIWDEVQTGHATANSFGLFLDSKVSDAGGGALTAQVIWEYTTRSITGATAGDYSEINNDITKGTTVY